jgi:hypothetical protein
VGAGLPNMKRAELSGQELRVLLGRKVGMCRVAR